jgi:hypothetical protein
MMKKGGVGQVAGERTSQSHTAHLGLAQDDGGPTVDKGWSNRRLKMRRAAKIRLQSWRITHQIPSKKESKLVPATFKKLAPSAANVGRKGQE